MICAIHQPNFLPYLGLFHKFKQADVFVLYNDAQYSKNDFHNRNRIKVSNNSMWITVPVKVKLGQKINEVCVVDDKYIEKHLKTIKQNYSKAKYFNHIFPDIERVYKNNKSNKLVDLNISLLKMIFNKFDKNKKVILSSEINLNKTNKSTEALIDICKKIGADKYISGAGARDYLDSDIFFKNSIELLWQNFIHPEYQQIGDTFIPNLSIVDALFNLGYEGTYNLI